MSPEEFIKSIDFICDYVFPKMGITSEHHLTIEYLGGEVLLIPHSELVENVNYARKRIGALVRKVRDGAQSNLIGSSRKILDLYDLFDGRVGTSWDNHTELRTVAGSSELYRGILNKSLKTIKNDRHTNPGRVIVLDDNTIEHVTTETSDALAGEYDLVIRPVFQGGSDDTEPASVDDMIEAMSNAFDVWKTDTERRVEPFYSLYNRRVSRGTTQQKMFAGCPFQSDCTSKSISLDPDGSLYVCQEMADSKNYPLGNALDGILNEDTWKMLTRRTIMLSDECSSCEWVSECGGGCMNESIQQFGDPFARTELCPLWKSIFAKIELEIMEPKVEGT
jgi:radical SAM protein with 4Fe4S-binding SPASM domain